MENDYEDVMDSTYAEYELGCFLDDIDFSNDTIDIYDEPPIGFVYTFNGE